MSRLKLVPFLLPLLTGACLTTILMAGGCVAHGSREMSVTIAGMEFGVKDTVHKDDQNVQTYTCDFSNWMAQFIQSFKQPAEPTPPPVVVAPAG